MKIGDKAKMLIGRKWFRYTSSSGKSEVVELLAESDGFCGSWHVLRDGTIHLCTNVLDPLAPPAPAKPPIDGGVLSTALKALNEYRFAKVDETNFDDAMDARIAEDAIRKVMKRCGIPL